MIVLDRLYGISVWVGDDDVDPSPFTDVWVAVSKWGHLAVLALPGLRMKLTVRFAKHPSQPLAKWRPLISC